MKLVYIVIDGHHKKFHILEDHETINSPYVTHIVQGLKDAEAVKAEIYKLAPKTYNQRYESGERNVIYEH